MELDLIITIKHNLGGCSKKWTFIFQAYRNLSLMFPQIPSEFYPLEQVSFQEKKILTHLILFISFVWVFLPNP